MFASFIVKSAGNRDSNGLKKHDIKSKPTNSEKKKKKSKPTI